MTMPTDKVTTLEAAIAAHVHDGDVVALQNMATQAAPMAAVRELIRQDKRELGLIVLVGGMAVDWLAAAGVINRLTGAAVSMEQFGLCQQYRSAVERGQIRVEELSETALNARLAAGARNLPFLPTRGLIGTDLIDINPENLVLVEDPFGGPDVVACRALVPDVALIHAHRADRSGNIQFEPTILWPDIGIMPKAAKRVIVTVEEIVDTSVLRRNPDRTVLPGFIVDAVVEVPYGAHPTSFWPRYGYDSSLHLEWAKVSRAEDTTNEFLDSFVRLPATHTDYLEAAGGATMLAAIERWKA
jgi:glutaconate CoA-transferase subunit A